MSSHGTSSAVGARALRPFEGAMPALVAAGWAGAIAVNVLAPRLSSTHAQIPPDVGLIATAVAAGGTLRLTTRRDDSWSGARLVGGGVLLVAIYAVVRWILRDLTAVTADVDGFGIEILLLLAVVLGGVVIDFRDHVRRDVSEIVSDVTLLAALVGGGVYFLLRADEAARAAPGDAALTVAIALTSVLVVAGSAVLLLWCPSRVHLALFGTSAMFATTGIALAWDRQYQLRDVPVNGIALLASISVASLAVALAVEPRLVEGEPRAPGPALWARPWLLASSLGGACVWLGVALLLDEGGTGTIERAALIAGVAALVSLRTLGNQRAMAAAASELASALREREVAIDSLQDAAEELAGSEARLRLMLDTAVDGIVELNTSGVVVGANDAFCAMVGLPPEDVVGHPWPEMIAQADPTGGLTALLDTGEAAVTSGGRTVHLEARTSTIPTDPPGTLLLVRDSTSSRVAEQTIRTLFQFLQDRDEDRTRYLRRTTLAIEAERNRIARDLHDGPIQGVVAASLSLEAVRLMIDANQQERAGEMLAKIRVDLSEETENLRRLMSDLRPPLLEERGLVPAVRDLCERFQENTAIRTSVRAAIDSAVPQEIETIAYRVIQEALSNVSRHAKASRVVVLIDDGGGTLQVEVEDDGRGFDSGDAREFLRGGKVGLASMRERTELGGGTFTVRSRPGAGTTVTATLPFDVLGTPRP